MSMICIKVDSMSHFEGNRACHRFGGVDTRLKVARSPRPLPWPLKTVRLAVGEGGEGPPPAELFPSPEIVRLGGRGPPSLGGSRHPSRHQGTPLP